MSFNKPTLKQIIAFKKSVENGGNITQAMKDAGYKMSTRNSPSNLTDSDGWSLLLEIYTPDEKLAVKLDEGLDATKQIGARKIVQGARTAHEIKVDATTDTDDFIEVEDYAIRHKYLETALKLKKRLTDKLDVTSDGERIQQVDISVLLDKVYGKSTTDSPDKVSDNG